MSTDSELRFALLDYLNNPHTHATLADAAKDFPEKYINERPHGASYSFWDMLEHIRINQNDMMDFMINPDYADKKWPEDYWPKPGTQANLKMWEDSVAQYIKDEEKLKKIIKDPSIDLLIKIPHGSGQTIFREIIQIIDHSSYHIGQLILMRKLIGQWK